MSAAARINFAQASLLQAFYEYRPIRGNSHTVALIARWRTFLGYKVFLAKMVFYPLPGQLDASHDNVLA